jgi:epoxyqueuosine reductase QueG
MEQKNDVRKLNQLSTRITLLDQKRKEALEQLVNQFCDLYGIPQHHRAKIMETEERYRGALSAVVFAVNELNRRGIDVSRVYWHRYNGLLIELADSKLYAEPINQEIKELAEQRKKQCLGWFIV